MVSQAEILAAASSGRRRTEGSLFVLSGLVSIVIIVVILLKFSQQFRELPKEEYRTWIAQKEEYCKHSQSRRILSELQASSQFSVERRQPRLR